MGHTGILSPKLYNLKSDRGVWPLVYVVSCDSSDQLQVKIVVWALSQCAKFFPSDEPSSVFRTKLVNEIVEFPVLEQDVLLMEPDIICKKDGTVLLADKALTVRDENDETRFEYEEQSVEDEGVVLASVIADGDGGYADYQDVQVVIDGKPVLTLKGGITIESETFWKLIFPNRPDVVRACDRYGFHNIFAFLWFTDEEFEDFYDKVGISYAVDKYAVKWGLEEFKKKNVKHLCTPRGHGYSVDYDFLKQTVRQPAN